VRVSKWNEALLEKVCHEHGLAGPLREPVVERHCPTRYLLCRNNPQKGRVTVENKVKEFERCLPSVRRSHLFNDMPRAVLDAHKAPCVPNETERFFDDDWDEYLWIYKSLAF
jgi:hypothetical protein